MNELENRFVYHKVDDKQVEIMSNIRQSLLTLAEEMTKLVPDCREKSLAIAHLEEAMMWFNAGVARRGLK